MPGRPWERQLRPLHVPVRRSRRAMLGTGLAVVAVVASGACGGGNFGDWEGRFHWGAHVPWDATRPEQARVEIELVDGDVGATMTAARIYRRWEDEFPVDVDRFLKSEKRLMVLSIKPIRADGTRIAWADIAAATDGSALAGEIRSWADRIRRYRRPIYVTFHHEPETTDDQASGAAADFVAAWRRFAEVMRASGGPHLRLMWIMTDRAFSADEGERTAAGNWYPGDEWVDAIGVDAFNWFGCRGREEGWIGAPELVEPARNFAAARPDKELWIAELGSVEDPDDRGRRAAWLAEVAALPRSPGWEQLHGVLYFDDEHGSEFPDCDWRLRPGAAAVAFGSLGTIPPDPPATDGGAADG